MAALTVDVDVTEALTERITTTLNVTSEVARVVTANGRWRPTFAATVEVDVTEAVKLRTRRVEALTGDVAATENVKLRVEVL